MSAVWANTPEARCGKELPDRRVIFYLNSYSKTELKELKNKLVSQLQCVRKFINRIESGTIGKKRTMPAVSDDDTETIRTLNKDTTAAMMRNCSVILSKLMKHKHAWVFNKPVDVVALGLDDYYQVIKRPMDLGTIKMKLGKRRYGTPIAFAQDVRLTFRNAMLYNRQGEDVYIMATELLNIFDKLFDPAYDKYEIECQRVIEDIGKALQVHPQAAPLPKKLCKEKAAKKSVSKTKTTLPEVKENPPCRKEMSVCERDKLALVVEDLAADYLNEILQIVAKRNSKMATPGEDGEIELDLEALDCETMWDLHRFARLHLKADQNRTRNDQITSQSTLTLENNKFTHERPMPTTPKVEEDIDIGDEMPGNDYPPVVIERDYTPCPANNARSSNSSSSSSGTDSSSDSDSSSGSDSEISDAA